MTTTSLKLSPELKARAAAAARKRGISTHAFMVEAIDLVADAAEKRASFISEAKAARRSTLRSREGYSADQVHDYLRRRAVSPETPRPPARPWRD